MDVAWIVMTSKQSVALNGETFRPSLSQRKILN
jgi:hypothetical protein